MNNIRDQFKNEFQSETLKGDSFYINDAAERVLKIKPYGEPTQVVIPEELGKTVEGESVVVSDGDVDKEVKATVNGNTKQETTEGYQLFDYSTKIIPNPSGLTVDYDKKTGYITVNGTPTKAYAGIMSAENITDKLEDGETYTLKQINYSQETYGGIYVQVGAFKADGSGTEYYSASNKAKTFTVNKSTYSKYTINIQTGSKIETFSNYQNAYALYKGTEDKPVEIFTNGVATPNPNHKQDVEVIDGVNRFDKDNENVVGGMFNESGFVEGQITSNKTCYIKIKPNQTYTIKKILSSKFAIATATDIPKNNVIPTTFIRKDTNTSISVTSGANDKYLWVWYWNKDNDTAILQEILDSLMIYEGTGDKPYLPYGHIGLVQKGKNGLNINDLIENGVSNTNLLKGLHLYLKPNTSYTVSTNMVSDSSSSLEIVPKVGEPENSSAFVFVTTDKATSSFTSGVNGVGTTKYKTRTFITDETGYLFIGCRTQYFSMLNDLIAQGGFIQLEEGTTATNNEPYHEPKTIEIDLAGNSLAENDNVKISVSGSVKANKVMNEYVFKGDETFSIILNGNNLRYFFNYDDILLDNASMKAYCNYFKNVDDIWNLTEKVDGFKFSSTNLNGFNIMAKDFETAEEFKAFLKEKYNASEPVKLLYESTEPQTIDLPSIEPITLFEGTNVFELVTNIGTTMAVTYNYVTPSPSIDRPSEIFTVQGDYETEKVNENLLPNELETQTINGITATVFKDGSINFKGTSTGTATFNIMNQRKNFLKNGVKYTFSSKNDMPINVFLRLNDVIDSSKFYQITGSEGIANKITFINDKIGEDMRCYVYFGSTQVGGTFDFTIYPKLEVGSTATPFTPHQSTTLPLTVGNELLGEIVTLTEEEADALKLDGAGKYVRTDYTKIKLTSDMDWKSTNDGKWFYIINNLLSIYDNSDIMCTHFKKTKASSSSLKSSEICLGNGAAGIIGISSLSFDNVDKLKTFLDENEVYVIAELATPTYEKITDETVLAQLKEYDKQIAFFGVNNINTYLVDDVNKGPLKLEVTYDKSNRMKGE